MEEIEFVIWLVTGISLSLTECHLCPTPRCGRQRMARAFGAFSGQGGGMWCKFLSNADVLRKLGVFTMLPEVESINQPLTLHVCPSLCLCHSQRPNQHIPLTLLTGMHLQR